MSKQMYYHQKVLVIGLGVSGRSAVDLLLQLGAFVTGYDQDLKKINPEVLDRLREKGLDVAVDVQLLDVSAFDCVVVSPGIPRTHPLYEAACMKGVPVLGEIELACRLIESRNQKFLAITGTNGKTTVTLLVTHVLNTCGIPARSLGNMGVPLTSECAQHRSGEVLVVELSSYQLETLKSQVIDAAVVLNITPDHLDRYVSMEDYARAKMRIASCLKSDGHLYVFQECWDLYGYLLPLAKPSLYGYDLDDDVYSDCYSLYAGQKELCGLPLVYRGKKCHDIENLMAAYCLCQEVGVLPEQFMKAVGTFKKPPHRIEFVRNIKEVSYYDDSKGTNVDAVIRAVQSLEGETILIAGGVDKGSAYSPWLEAFGKKVKCICAIGVAAKKMEKELSTEIPVHLFESLEMAVHYAASVATKGDNVLLSPGCASFDMFRDYAHRGDEFKRIVNEFERGNYEST